MKHLSDNCSEHKKAEKEKKAAALRCQDCGMQFDRQERLEMHDHWQARHSKEPFDYYKLIDPQSSLGELLLSLPIHQSIPVCLEQHFAVPGLFPAMSLPMNAYENQLNLDLYKSCGNLAAAATYEKVCLNLDY